MKEFDLDKLEKAIIYAERMADGREPYSNKPVENEVLNNPNVIRSMFFIREVLQAVKANGGVVGGRQPKTVPAASFPFEVLEQFEYEVDKAAVVAHSAEGDVHVFGAFGVIVELDIVQRDLVCAVILGVARRGVVRRQAGLAAV